MKSVLLITTWLLFSASMLHAQQQGKLREDSRDRIEAERIGYITQKLHLTPEEATRFWPLYNEYKDKVKELRDEVETTDPMNISDSEAALVVDRHLQTEARKLELKKELYNKLESVISSKKILLLHGTEREFNRQLLWLSIPSINYKKPIMRKE